MSKDGPAASTLLERQPSAGRPPTGGGGTLTAVLRRAANFCGEGPPFDSGKPSFQASRTALAAKDPPADNVRAAARLPSKVEKSATEGATGGSSPSLLDRVGARPNRGLAPTRTKLSAASASSVGMFRPEPWRWRTKVLLSDEAQPHGLRTRRRTKSGCWRC